MEKYKNLSFFLSCDKNKELFLIRLSSSVYKKGNQTIKSDGKFI